MSVTVSRKNQIAKYKSLLGGAIDTCFDSFFEDVEDTINGDYERITDKVFLILDLSITDEQRADELCKMERRLRKAGLLDENGKIIENDDIPGYEIISAAIGGPESLTIPGLNAVVADDIDSYAYSTKSSYVAKHGVSVSGLEEVVLEPC